jgi:hypothetical protein
MGEYGNSYRRTGKRKIQYRRSGYALEDTIKADVRKKCSEIFDLTKCEI